MNLNRLPCAAYDGNLISLMFYFYDVPAPGSFMEWIPSVSKSLPYSAKNPTAPVMLLTSRNRIGNDFDAYG